jgi:pimeloyl-ACP methyl ester carboxylesterase
VTADPIAPVSPPIVLVHGFASSGPRTWGESGWLDLLGDSGRRVVTVDLLGHGDADKPHDPHAYDQLEELALASFPDEPVDAIGFSLGARTLLVLASTHPERFHRLVLAGIGANLFRPDQSAAVLADSIEQADSPPSAEESPVAQYFRSQAREPGSDPIALAACLRRDAPAITDEGLARITCPVLLVIGDQDFAGPADPLAERLADVRVVTLRGVDHFATPKDFGFLDAGLEFVGAGLG